MASTLAPGPGVSPWDQALAAAESAGLAAWPGVSSSRARLAAHAARVKATVEDLIRHGADLFLASACADGDLAAITWFEKRFLPVVDGALAKMRLGPTAADDVRQNVRVLLLTAPSLQIAAYAGRGPLAGWLRTVTVRAALKVLAADRSAAELAGEVLDRLLVKTVEPELHVVRRGLAAEFQAALEQSLLALTPRAKTILRLHYVEGLNIDAIGDLYEVHRATVARWLTATHKVISTNLRERLARTVRSSSSEFESLAAALREDLHISVERLLPAEDP